MDQSTLHQIAVWFQNNAAWLQVAASLIAIPVTVYGAIVGARQGARLAYTLSEKSVLDRERRVHEEQQKIFEEQKNSIRLLLRLELERNHDDLNWLYSNLTNTLGEGEERYIKLEEVDVDDVDNAEKYKWVGTRCRFIALHMPDWSHRFWYGQQSSHLLPQALSQSEIKQINFIHSELDRLTKIKNMLAERAHQYDVSQLATPDEDQRGLISTQFKEELPSIWYNFVTTLRGVLDLDLPLKSIPDKSIAGNTSPTTAAIKA